MGARVCVKVSNCVSELMCTNAKNSETIAVPYEIRQKGEKRLHKQHYLQW